MSNLIQIDDYLYIRTGYVVKSISDLKKYLTLPEEEKGKEVARWLVEQGNKHSWSKEDLCSFLREKSSCDLFNREEDRVPPSSWVNFFTALDINELYVLSSSEDEAYHPPSFIFLKYKELLKNQWMVHFTDASSAVSIAKEGFTKGIASLKELGSFSQREERPGSGFNFSFLPQDIEDSSVAAYDYYGESVVLFRASGLLAYHVEDGENQVIFDGKTVDNIVPIIWDTEKSTYSISSCKSKRHIRNLENKEERWKFPSSKNLQRLVNWTISNFSQYRKHLVCR